jgi:hypothetical protein
MTTPLHFFDIEASSLGEGSFPIEVGWARVAGETDAISTGAMLIRPRPDWTAWSVDAQRVHRISRDELLEHGRPLSEVAEALDAEFGGGQVLSDAPEWDGRWIDVLYDALGRKRQWRIAHALLVLRALVETPVDGHWLSQHLDDPRPHRADRDALLLAQALVHLRRQRTLRAQSPSRST